MASIAKRPNGRWRARYRDGDGREHARHFDRKVEAQKWLDAETAKLVVGTWTDPKHARMTMSAWCSTWLAGYGGRPGTVKMGRTHIERITAEFGDMPLISIRPSHVRTWCARLAAEGLADSYVYALHARLAQVFSDAVHDGIVPRSPCSRRTSPRAGKQRPYVATTAQVWGLYEAMTERRRTAVLLGAFVGLRAAEACGLRVSDLDLMRGIVHPTVQYPADQLKSETSRTAVPIPRSLTLLLARHIERWPAETVLTADTGRQLGPWMLDREFARSREAVEGLPEGFRFHDLRHYFASLLIASGANIKVVQHRMRHATASTTLDTYSHLWPDSDESTRAAIEAVLTARADSVRTAGV